jgi:hypothetical protein
MTADALPIPCTQGHPNQSDVCSHTYMYPAESGPSRGHFLCQYELSRAIGTQPSSPRAYLRRVCQVMLSRPSPFFHRPNPRVLSHFSKCITTSVCTDLIESNQLIQKHSLASSPNKPSVSEFSLYIFSTPDSSYQQGQIHCSI